MPHLTRLNFNMGTTCSKRHMLQLDFVSSHSTYCFKTNNKHEEIDDKMI